MSGVKKVSMGELGTLFKAKGPDGEVIEKEVNLGDHDLIAIYFSAHWCPPCKGFTPLFAEMYTKWRMEGKKFEVIFISLDNDETQFNTYYEVQPWLAVPYGEERVGNMLKLFGVQGIPACILITGDGIIVEKNARKDVMMTKSKAITGWETKVQKIRETL